MNNTFAQIDHLASAGDSPWHRSSALTKLLLVLTYVTLAVVTPSWGVLVALLVTLVAMCVSARAPLRLMLAAAATPFLFAPLSRVLPRGIGDGLFLTYRAVFALYARVERMGSTLRLRGAMARPMRDRFALLGEAVGTVVLSGFDRSQRLYQTMQLRGHSGRICGCRHYLEFSRDDFWVCLAIAWAGVVSVTLWHVRAR